MEHHGNHFKPFFFPRRLDSRHVDLRQWMLPIKYQGDLGSCSANAIATIIEYTINRTYGVRIPASRLFIYYNARREELGHSGVYDKGAYLESTVKAVQKYGFCEEHIWPYYEELVNEKPSPEAYEAASRSTIKPLRVPISLPELKAALANGFPVAIDIALRNSAGTLARRNNGYISVPSPEATTVRNSGMHAIVLVGYDESTQHFIVRNSWGEDWGLKGEFYLPYEYLTKRRLIGSSDGGWTVQRILTRRGDPPSIRMVHAPLHTKHTNDPHGRKHKRHHKTKH